MKHAVDADLDLLEELVRPYFSEVEAHSSPSRTRIVRLKGLALGIVTLGAIPKQPVLGCIRLSKSYGRDLGIVQRLLLLLRCIVLCDRILLRHVAMEEAVVKKVLRTLYALHVVASIIQLDLAH